jgi:hypothetical protein
MGKAAPKEIHLFANAKTDYKYVKISGTVNLAADGLVMYSFSQCEFQGVPLKGRTKAKLDETKIGSSAAEFYFYIYDSSGNQLYSVGKNTVNPSDIFNLDIPAKAQIDNATVRLYSKSYIRFNDISFT